MDLRLFAAVVSRFKKLAIGGVIAAIVLAGLAYLRGGGPPVWEAQAEVLITQANDPYGGPTPAVVNEGGYLGGLTTVYAAMANGDAAQAMVRRAANVPNGVVSASEVVDPQTGNPEPLVTLTSSASTPGGALSLAERMPAVLQKYITAQQEDAAVPKSQRVQLAPIKNGFPPEIVSSKTKTVLPILVFMGVLAAVLTLIFMLENANPKTAAALGRDPALRSGGYGAAASGELAAVLTALVHGQQAVSTPSGAPQGSAADVSARPVNGREGAEVSSANDLAGKRWGDSSGEHMGRPGDVLRTRTLREARATNGHSIDESGHEPADHDAAVMKRLLRRQS